jgi:hypothetical protein
MTVEWRRYVVMALAVAACGEPAGPAPAEGEYSFAASYGASGYTCTLTGAILSLELDIRGWTGWLSGGEIGCTGGIPGETVVPAPPDGALDSIVVRGDSVSFRLEGAEFVAQGTLSGGNLAGTLEVARPFCQCTDPVLTGTWTASRVQPSSAKAMVPNNAAADRGPASEEVV